MNWRKRVLKAIEESAEEQHRFYKEHPEQYVYAELMRHNF